MAHLIEVAFRGNRKEFFTWDGDTPPALRAGIIVEADRGEDFGHVHSTGDLAAVRCKGCVHGCGTAAPARKALRLADAGDRARNTELTQENETVRRAAQALVRQHGLIMKITDAEWQFDRRKLTVFFTAEKRVDFRGLVRELAASFRARIELQQIGVRDEAKRLSGIGRCGREYCSASWLPDLRPVNLGVAKDQKLSLNPQQISGACGRLMCCLRYEHEFYVQSRRRFPKEGRILTTSRGEEKVMACDIFNDRVTLRTADGDTRVVPLAELRAEIDGSGETAGDPSLGDPSLGGTSAGDAAEGEAMLVETVMVDVAVLEPMAAAPVIAAPAVLALVEHEAPALESDDDADADADEEAEAEAETDAPRGAETEADAEVRRKRRRGRRGGRRLRAAEQRRQQHTDGAGESPADLHDEGPNGDPSTDHSSDR